MKQRCCALTIRFGKDIAGLIHWWAWRSKMQDVNLTYKSSVEVDENDRIVMLLFKTRFLMNFRCLHTPCNGSLYIYNYKHSCHIAKLPNHYWTIKELY